MSTFNDFLDEVYGTFDVAGVTFNASRILKELDPIAYQCAVHDYEDMLAEDCHEG